MVLVKQVFLKSRAALKAEIIPVAALHNKSELMISDFLLWRKKQTEPPFIAARKLLLILFFLM